MEGGNGEESFPEMEREYFVAKRGAIRAVTWKRSTTDWTDATDLHGCSGVKNVASALALFQRREKDWAPDEMEGGGWVR